MGTLYGRPIKPEEAREAYRQAKLVEEMSGGRRQVQGGEERMAYENLLIDEKLRQMAIVPGDEQVAEYVKEHLRDSSTGQLMYDQQVALVKARGYAEADYVLLLRRAIGQRHLMDLVSIPGQLVTPREAEAEFRRENEQAMASAVFFSSSNFLAGVQITAPALGQFFTNRIANYRTPEKMVAAYVKFGTNSFLAKAEQDVAKVPDLVQRLEAAYNQRTADAFRDSQGNPLAKDAALAQLRDEFVRSTAVSYAAEQANAFYNDLGQIEPLRPENLETLAAKKGLKVEITQPFSGFERPLGLESLRNLSQQLAQLDANSPFTEPLSAADGVYIVSVKQHIPTVTPTLDAVRVRVTEDFRRSQALDAAGSAGQAFHNVATNAVAAGKTFAALVADQKLTAVDLPPFSLSMTSVPGLPPQADLNSLKDAAFALQPGQVSNFIRGRDGGYVLYLRERRPASDEMVKAELPKYMTELRQREEGRGFSEWFTHEFAASGLKEHFEPRQKAAGVTTPR